MALNLVDVISKFAKLNLSSHVILRNYNFLGICIPVREKHGLLKDRTKHDNYWVPRRRPLTDDKLTFESKKFLQEVISDKFIKPGESPLKEPSEERAKWTPNSRRTGVIVRKLGVYPMWMKDGTKVQTTLLQVVDNHVIRYNPPEIFAQSKYADKYKEKEPLGSLVVGAESSDPQLFTAAYNGLFSEAGVLPKRKLTRFRITPDAVIDPGTPLFATHFKVGQYVNVYGISRYHGFQGVMKRWGYKGGPASHGNTKSHRRPGCIGAGRKDHVWKGKKLPGLHGGWRKLMVGLKVLRINTRYNILYVKGQCVPGVNSNYCYIYDCNGVEKKKFTEDNPPFFPTYYPGDIENLREEYYDEEVHKFSDPSIVVDDDFQVKEPAIVKSMLKVRKRWYARLL